MTGMPLKFAFIKSNQNVWLWLLGANALAYVVGQRGVKDRQIFCSPPCRADIAGLDGFHVAKHWVVSPSRKLGTYFISGNSTGSFLNFLRVI